MFCKFYRSWGDGDWVYIQWLDIAHDDVIKWKQFPRHWPFVRGIHRSPVDSGYPGYIAHKGQWWGALMFSLISTWTNGWANNGDADDLRCHCAHYDVTVMHCALFNTLKLKQNDRHFAHSILKCIFLNEKLWFWTKTLSDSVCEGTNDTSTINIGSSDVLVSSGTEPYPGRIMTKSHDGILNRSV